MAKIKKSIFDVISFVLLGVGVVFMISPFLLYQWIHGDYERYLWIINGPDPFNKLGSGPYQLVIYLGLLFIGIVITLCALLLKKKKVI